MKIIFYIGVFLLSFNSYSQSYQKEWDEIYKLEEKGSYKTLLQRVNDVHKKASKNKNESEKAKAFLFQMKVENVLKETTYQNKIERLQNEISSSKGVFQSIYRWYYIKTLLRAYETKQSYWRRNQLVETTTTSLPKEIDLWSENQFKEEIVKQARLLFQNESILKNTKITEIKDLVDYNDIKNNLNQSVYEFFATTFFDNYSYSFSDKNFLKTEVNDFGTSFSSKRISFPLKANEVRQELGKYALQIAQDLEKHYQQTNQLQALDKIRYLRFNKFYYNVPSDHEAFQNLGTNLKTNFYKNRWHAMYANKLSDEADKIDKKDNYKLALEQIAKVKQNKSENDEWQNVDRLENYIKESKFSISLKKEVYENEPVKYRIDYKNTDTLHLAYYDFSKHQYLNDSVYQWVIKNQEPIDKAIRVLPKSDPYFETSTEILGNNLPLGEYLLVCYSNEKQRNEFSNNRLGVFKTTNVWVFWKNLSKEKSALYIVHPKTGKPYAKTPIRYYNERLVTDVNGKVEVKNEYDSNENRYLLEVYLPNETYKTNLYPYSYGQYVTKNTEARKASIEIYSDRSLYRPGQEVYFKGILYESSLQGNEVLSQKSFHIILKDDNGDEVEKMIVTTNEWGAFSGKFVLPKFITTGNFLLVPEKLKEYTQKEEEKFWQELSFPHQYLSSRVEEYKRPTFDVTIESIKKQISFDENITIKGKASSLAGGAIANAKVVFNVNSSYYDRNSYNTINLIKINKEILTNEIGEFEISFIVPSDSIKNIISKELIEQNVRYEVIVTDAAGEVREDEGYFNVSNYKKEITVFGTNITKTDNPLKISIQSKEVNGDFSPVTGNVKIYQTLPRKQFFEKRPWNYPELHTIDLITFNKLFPYQSYSKKEEETQEKKLVYEGKYTTQKEKSFEMNIKNWKTGNYELVFEINDELSGLPINKKTSFSIKNAEEKLATNENFNVVISKNSNAKSLEIETNSIYDKVHLHIEFFDKDTQIRYQNLVVNKGSQLHKIPLATNGDNTEITFNWYFVYNHELYNGLDKYTIPSKEKIDEIEWKAEWISWNNKLNPAQQYQWKLLLKNAKNNQAFQGEFLASMYDASLDRIVIDYWNTNLSRINNYVSVRFSQLNKNDIVQRNSFYNFFNHYQTDLYLNDWNYYNYNFNTYDIYEPYYYNIPYEIRFEKQKYFDIEVRDAVTGKVISTALVFNFKTNDSSTTNEDGFASLLGKKSIVIGVLALGYEETRLEVNKQTTIVHLKPSMNDSSQWKVDFNKTRNTWYNIHRQYTNDFSDASKPEQDEVHFLESVIKKDSELTRQMDFDDTISYGIDGDLKSNGELTGGASKLSKGAASGDLSTVRSKTIEGRPNATMINNLLGQVPGLNIATGAGNPGEVHKTIALRKNLSETAFFYPHLVFNKKGEVEINFTAPEALTEWKFRGLAHDKKMNLKYVELFSKTQKDVMIQPNMPRFVREGDQIVLKARVSNTTDQPMKATALLRLFNTITGEEISTQIIKSEALVPTTIQPFSATTVSWNVHTPQNIEGLQYRISVQSGIFTDGEESVIPVLSNRQLVTETLPIWQLANETKTYQLNNLFQNTSQSLQNHQLRVDVSNNATWLIMQTFPYLMDYQHQCSEQLFARFFANVLSLHILENKPEIAKLVKEWKENPTSKLEQNEELKQIMLQETPWMKDLISDEEKKAQFSNYFDTSRLNAEAEKIQDILVERQLPSGAVSWFSGGEENEYITQHILVTAAQLKKLGVRNPFLDNKEGFINKANRYLDIQFENEFSNKLEPSFSDVIDYVFVKSYYKDVFNITQENQNKINKRFVELKKNWVNLSLYHKAKLAIVAQRKGDTKWANEIIDQMEESSLLDETYGMYWRENTNKYYYYFNAAEVQSLIIEAYKETNRSQDKIQRLYAWLLSQKLNNNWGTTKATTQALYAILLGQQNVNLEKGKIQVVIGKEKFVPTKEAVATTEEAAGNYSYQFVGDQVKSEMGKVEVKNTMAQPLFGGMYWQYFEDLSSIQSSQEGLLNIKRIYLKETKDNKWEEISASTPLALGEKVKVRIQINATKDMSFVHVKDVRPATFEPLDVLSGYHYKNGLGYYQSTKDVATHFFIDYLHVGTYVLEYDVRLNNEGIFTSGISTIQSMYAPEHTGHTSGTKIEVK